MSWSAPDSTPDVNGDRQTTRTAIHKIKYFLAVVMEGNFSRVTIASNVTQPSLTRGIRKLEAVWETDRRKSRASKAPELPASPATSA